MNDTNDREPASKPTFEESRGAALLVCAVVLATFLAVVGLPIVLGALAWNSIPDRYREVVEHPDQDFARITGLAWPAGAKVLSVDDDHGGFHGDGSFYLIAEVDRATLERWKAGSPPFGAPEWSTEPLHDDATGWCSFNRELRSPYKTYENGELMRDVGWQGDPELLRVLRGSDAWRAVKDRSPDRSWANGVLLALDFETNRFWLCVWDT